MDKVNRGDGKDTKLGCVHPTKIYGPAIYASSIGNWHLIGAEYAVKILNRSMDTMGQSLTDRRS